MGRSRRRGPSGNETGIGTLQEDRETLEEVASGRGGKGCRTCGRLFSDEPEMKEGVTVPTAKCFDDEGDKQNAISLTGPRVFIYLGSFHRLEGGAGGDGRPRKGSLTERRCNSDVERCLATSPVLKKNIAWPRLRIRDEGSCFLNRR